MTADEEAQRLRAGWISLVAGFAIFGGKLAAWAVTGSTAVLSDALESIVNVAAAALLVWALHIAARPADRDHPYGHGKIEFFSAGIEGTLILVAAAIIAWEAVRDLITGPELARLGLGSALLAGFAAANLLLGVYLGRVARATRSQALEADAQHILTDVWTTGGVLLGLGLVHLTGWQRLDPLVALVVAANILRTGWGLAREAAAGLMDAADEPTLEWVVSRLAAARMPEWIDVHGLRSWRAGSSVHVDLHLVVPRYLLADDLHAIHERIERELAPRTGENGSVVVHFDPCRPRACSHCVMDPCPVREAPFRSRSPIDLASARRTDPEVELAGGAG
ncbi:MAG: cation diffusion facilitator family transporter [Myxococcota bacterium]